MKKTLFLAAVAALALVGCQKENGTSPLNMQNEMSFVALNGNLPTRGYTTGNGFLEVTYENLQNPGAEEPTYRDMQISAYLYPQNGEQGNYFVGKKFVKGTTDNYWHNFETPIYWPVGGTLDFLAFSLSKEAKNVTVAWDEANAASKVVLGVPAENSQNDILFSSVAGQQSKSTAGAVPMLFNHAQAWLEFVLKAGVNTPENAVTFKRIELENVYNAGDLTITNNGGHALAEWSFAGQPKNIEVDNNRAEKVKVLSQTAQYLDMLIPQQKKTAFVLYYTLGSNPQELSYRFTTDLKTWLMGEKYVYNITINTAEIIVEPSVTSWKPIPSEAGETHDIK